MRESYRSASGTRSASMPSVVAGLSVSSSVAGMALTEERLRDLHNGRSILLRLSQDGSVGASMRYSGQRKRRVGSGLWSVYELELVALQQARHEAHMFQLWLVCSPATEQHRKRPRARPVVYRRSDRRKDPSWLGSAR